MDINTSNISAILSKFGLPTNEQKIYILLKKYEWITVLKMAQLSGIKRTTIYRVLETLSDKGLVETQLDDKTTYYRSTDLKNLETVIIEKENEIKDLKNSMDELKNQFDFFSTFAKKQTAVRFYRGVRGIKAMEWKISQQGGNEYIMGNSEWDSVMGREFAEKVRLERVRKGTIVYELLNSDDVILEDLVVSWTGVKPYLKNHYLHRTLDKKIFEMASNIIVVADSICLFSYQKDDVVGIEIVSASYAQMMKGLFRMLWNQGEIIDGFGGGKL